MKWYPWLRPSFEQLVGSYQAGRGHHALLLQSLNGMGGEALIYALCRFLMCRQPEGHKSCGHCHSCQLMQAGTHPITMRSAPRRARARWVLTRCAMSMKSSMNMRALVGQKWSGLAMLPC